MSVLLIILPVALILAAGALAAFIWMTRQGQLDDLDTPPWRVVMDDDPPQPPPPSPPHQ